MKKNLTIIAILLAAFNLQAQDKSLDIVKYSLPRTSIVLNVTAVKEIFHAGPYAEYGKKYLGIRCSTKDSTSFKIKSVEIKSFTEADPAKRYSIHMNNTLMPFFMNFSNQGIISFATPRSAEDKWRFPGSGQDAFATKPLPSNLESRQHHLIRESGEGFVSQDALVIKSLEDKAAETASKIFEIRTKKYNILIGNTDATYSGEAMNAAIKELNKIEHNLLALFIGYCEKEQQKAVFEVIPVEGQLKYVAFRISNANGLVSNKDISGSPVRLELTPEEIAEAQPAAGKSAKPKQLLYYSIPAVCKVILSEGSDQILETRIPVYQLGKTETFPLFIPENK